MPIYEYFCEACRKEFELALAMHEHDKDKIDCPKCGNQTVHQMVSAFTAVTSRKN